MEQNCIQKPIAVEYYKTFMIEDYRGIDNALGDFKVTRIPFGASKDRTMKYSFWFKLKDDANGLCLSKCVLVFGSNMDAKEYGEVVIPREVAGYPVEEIGESAFEENTQWPFNMSGMQSIMIPSSVKKIGAWAFKNCRFLNKVTLPDSIVFIGRGAFYNSGLESITISQNVAIIEEGAFAACLKLTSLVVDEKNKIYDSREQCNAIIHTKSNRMIAVCQSTVIPDSVAVLDCAVFMESALNGIKSIKKYTFPDTDTEIGNYAFRDCKQLREIEIPKSVNAIGYGAFSNCSKLFKITVSNANKYYDSRNQCNAIIETSSNTLIQGCAFTRIPDSITKIGKGAFEGCTCLTSVVLPDSVVEIADDAFKDCDNLEEVYISDSILKIGRRVFENCESLKKIFINEQSLLKSACVPQGVSLEANNTDTRHVYSKMMHRKMQNRQCSPLLKEKYKYYDYGPDPHEEVKSNRSYYENPFDIIFSALKKVNFYENGEAMNHLLFNLMMEHLEFFIKNKYIKFINIFNHAKENELGYISYFADFIHSGCGLYRISSDKSLITEQMNQVDVGNDNYLFGGSESVTTVEQLLHLKDVSLKTFEFCSTYSKPLFADENDYYVIKNEKQFEYIYSERLLKFFYSLNSKQRGEKKQKFNQWLDCVDRCYESEDNGVTNFFFFMGNSEDTKEQNMLLDKYCLCANIGVDNRKLADNDHDKLYSFLKEFKIFIEQLSFNIIVKIKNYQLHQTAVVASIAQVMARNMSHNIGSHVFSHLVGNNVLQQLSDESIFKVGSYIPLDETKKIEMSLQLPYFNQYLKSRMDYLSEVTFGIPNMLATRYIFGDVFKELDRVRILLNYISGIPGFKYTFCLKYNGVDLSDENDIAVAFPSDVLGTQAFYNIIENIIRNTAKHACNDDHDVVTFTIEFSDMVGYPGYYCVEIDNGIAEAAIDDLVQKQNDRINTSVLVEDNNLRSHSLGLLEMGASAAFLRQVDIAKVDSYEYHFDDKDEFTNKHGNLVLLKAINKNGALGYRMFLQKPKELLFVGAFDVEDSMKDVLAKEGVNFITEDEFAEALAIGQSFAHPFLVYLDSASDKTKDLLSDDSDCKTLLPARKLRVEQEDANSMMKIINTSEGDEIVRNVKQDVWTRYYENVIVKELRNPNNDETIIVTEFDGFSSPINNQVVFLNHATKSQHEKYWHLFKEDRSFEGWIENLSSRTCSKLPAFSKYSIGADNAVSQYVLNIEDNKPLNYEIFEAYHNKVLVLDERVQKFSQENFEGSSNKTGGQIPCSSLFESTNVLMPGIELDRVVFDEDSIKTIEQFINDNMANAFVLIHYGILERMYKKETVRYEKLVTWSKVAKRLVVTSGRGAHSLTLPPSVCFVNLSSVLYAFTENRNKFIINNLLNQTRRKNE